MIEEFFLKRRRVTFENWQIGLLFIFAVFGIIGFGALVEYAASDPYRSNVVANTSLQVARLPAETRHVVTKVFKGGHPQVTRKQRFEGQSGFQFGDAADGLGGLLILSRYDFDIKRSVVELLDTENGTVFHKYVPDFKTINSRSQLSSSEVNFARDHHPERYMITHPFIEENGSIVFQGMGTPLVKVDVCSRIEWTLDGEFHHSIERDFDKNYWTATRTHPSTIAMTTSEFADDTIVKISPEGEILFQKSVGKLLIENELEYLVYSGDDYTLDPFHVNDIQPVLGDGPHWRRGDVFISMRNRSAAILYRPETNEVLWHQEGPWLAQHDIDIVSEHEISIFNNHTAAAPGGEYVLGTNDVLLYDFRTGEVSSPYKEGFRRHKIRTITDGLSEVLPNGDLFVEEQNFGRILMMTPEGDLRWSYVNRASDQQVYHVQWSRYGPAEELNDMRDLLVNVDCSPS